MDEAFEESKAKADLAKRKKRGAAGIFESPNRSHGCGHNQTIIARERLTDEWKVGAVETTLGRGKTYLIFMTIIEMKRRRRMARGYILT